MKYSVNPACTVANLGEETVILNSESGVYFSLNEVGGFLWERMSDRPLDFEDLVTAVMAEYDTDEATCRSDIREIMDELSREKLIMAG